MNGMNEIQFYIRTYKDEMIRFWENLVTIDSGADCREGIKKVAEQIKDALRPMGFDIKIQEQENGSPLFIGEYGDVSQPFILLIGHMDTVFPQGESGRRHFYIKDGRVFGPGVLDMKGGLTVMVYALKAWIGVYGGALPIRIILAGDEEINHRGSNVPSVFRCKSQGALCCFNFETGFIDRGIVVQRRGGVSMSNRNFWKVLPCGQ